MGHLKFSSLRDDWSLDVVNILAFLGEHNILATSQQICMSRLCFLPRLIPAPQGLLAERARNLRSVDNIEVQGVNSGNQRPTLNYFANVLHGDGTWLGPYTTRVLEIKIICDGPPIRPRLLSPLNLIAMISFTVSVGIAAWAIIIGDGVGLTGVLIMSMTTPLLCIGLKSSWSTPRRRMSLHAPRPQSWVVYRLPNGSITVVRCDEEVARLLYFHPDGINYTLSSYSGRGISGIAGGMMLVGSLVLFSNATWTIKAALVIAYTVLNLLYWLAAIFPARWSWHMDFEVKEELIQNSTFTQGLWSAMWASQAVDWVLQGDHAPNTDAWKEWIEKARDALSRPREEFNSQRVLGDIMSELYERK
jgi:hypothetical protein